MFRVKLPEPRSGTHVFRKGRHIARMIDAVLDPRRLAREKAVVRYAGREGNFVEEEEGPEHRLLFGDGRDGAYAWSDEADEPETDIGAIADLSYVHFARSTRVSCSRD